MTIEQADLRHLAEISRIERENFPDPWSGEYMRDRLEDPGCLFLAALEGDRVLGYSVLQTVADEAELHNIAVDRSARRRGVGRALLRAALAGAGARGAEKVFLEARTSNTPAIALYRSTGFVPLGIRPGYYLQPREDAVVMQYTFSEEREEKS